MEKDPEKNELNESTDIFPDWSKIDAMSIYRSSGGSPTPIQSGPADLSKVKRKTSSFLKIFISFIVIICLIVFISGR